MSQKSSTTTSKANHLSLQGQVSLTKLPLHQSISILKQQLRQQRQKVIILGEQHKQQIEDKQRQISSLKQHILEMREKQYINQLMGEQQSEQQREQLLKLRQQNYQFKIKLQKLQEQISQYQQVTSQLHQQNLQLKSTLTTIQRQKQKHLEISITQKITLQTRIQLLQKQLQMNEAIVNKLKHKQLQNQKLQHQNTQRQKYLNKQLTQVELIKKQLQTYNSFQTQKIKQHLTILQKQNNWLRQHLQQINTNHSSQSIDKKNTKNNTYCTNPYCQEQIQSYKNKFIQKTRQLAKLKTQLTKGLFKEKFSENNNNKDDKQNYLKDNKQNYLFKTKPIDQNQQKYQSNTNNKYQRSSSIQKKQKLLVQTQQTNKFSNKSQFR